MESDITSNTPTIVIAEDDDDFRILLATILRMDGHPVLDVGTGEQLSCYLIEASNASREPVLVIADVILPGMSGFAACRLAREHGCTSRFVFMSTFNNESMIDEAIELGPTGVFRKPFEIDALRLTVADYNQPA